MVITTEDLWDDWEETEKRLKLENLTIQLLKQIQNQINYIVEDGSVYWNYTKLQEITKTVNLINKAYELATECGCYDKAINLIYKAMEIVENWEEG